MNGENIQKQIAFIVEVDKIKHIFRHSRLFDSSRYENASEHSWTACLLAVLLKDCSNTEINLERVLIMLLIHDIVEIDAGDTFLYSKDRQFAFEKELIAAERIFGILNTDQKKNYMDLWVEFEDRQTAEAKFAAVCDRLEPILQNYLNQGAIWKKHNITRKQVIEKNRHIAEGSEEIWSYVECLIEESVKQGYLED